MAQKSSVRSEILVARGFNPGEKMEKSNIGRSINVIQSTIAISTET